MAIVFMCIPFTDFTKSLSTQRWNTVIGRITHSELIKNYKRTFRNDHTIEYEHFIEYEYSVDNKICESTFISFKELDPREVVAKYNENNVVTVFYNPKKPEEAVLLHGKKLLFKDTLFLTGFCLAVFQICALIFWKIFL